MNIIYNKLKTFSLSIILCILGYSCQNKEKETPIKAFCIDYNWRIKSDSLATNGNKFAPPGAWAEFDAKEQVEWLKDLGCNVIQSFAVSSNGYAWYKNDLVAEQPGLNSDFFTDLVKIGRENNMKVFGYFCVGSNEKWGLEHPDESYGTPHQPHIPFTKEYINYLTAVIKDAIEKTDMDGFMIDWLWNPTAAVCGPAREQKWLKCEQQMYVELMGKPFPGKENVSAAELLEYNRRAIDRCWKAIYTVTKTTKPNCLIWLSCSQIKNPEIINSNLLKQIDWLQNEAGDKESVDFARSQTGKHTRLLTTLSTTFLKRMNLKAEDVVKYALEDNIGIYCYTGFSSYNEFFPPVESYLKKPLSDFDAGNEKNIALLARIFNGYPPEYVKK